MPPRDLETTRWFTEEVLPHEPALRAWLRGRFPMVSDLDDLVQEAYSRMLRVQGTGSIACAKAFLFVTARNLALNQLRHLRYECTEESLEFRVAALPDESVAIPESVAYAEDLQLLIRAIQELPDRCRQVMTLRKIYGLSQREVADKLGISEHTVEAQGAIGLRKCIAYFRRHGYSAGFRS